MPTSPRGIPTAKNLGWQIPQIPPGVPLPGRARRHKDFPPPQRCKTQVPQPTAEFDSAKTEARGADEAFPALAPAGCRPVPPRRICSPAPWLAWETQREYFHLLSKHLPAPACRYRRAGCCDRDGCRDCGQEESCSRRDTDISEQFLGLYQHLS